MSIAPLRGPAARGEQEQPLRAGSYVTDGRRLFRVVSAFNAGQRSRFAALEDCLSLRVQAYSTGELVLMKLRPVSIAAHP